MRSGLAAMAASEPRSSHLCTTSVCGGDVSLRERFTFLRKLGDGMTACVYQVRERATGRLYACKLAQAKQHNSIWGRVAQLIRRESTILQEIGRHPCLVHWHSFHEGSNEIAIVMDLVVGDCQQLLQRHGSLAEAMVRQMIHQLQSALRCALITLHLIT